MVFRKHAAPVAKPAPVAPARPAWMNAHVVDPAWYEANIKNHPDFKPPLLPDEIIADQVGEYIDGILGGNILTEGNTPFEERRANIRDAARELIDAILDIAAGAVPNGAKYEAAREALRNLPTEKVSKEPRFQHVLAIFVRSVHKEAQGVVSDIRTDVDRYAPVLERSVWHHWIANESGTSSIAPEEILSEGLEQCDDAVVERAYADRAARFA